MPRRKKKNEDRIKVQSIEIVKTTRDLTEEQIRSVQMLIEKASSEGYRITKVSFL